MPDFADIHHGLISLELCAGAGGQALGLERAGFEHAALLEQDAHACQTLRSNRGHWQVLERDLRTFRARAYRGIDLVAAGVPCPPFSKAGAQLGADDERDLFPDALRVVREVNPRAVMFENVRGLLDPAFDGYRASIQSELEGMGYQTFWKLHHASDFGVPQLRPRTILVALKRRFSSHFDWPAALDEPAPTVGVTLYDEMASLGWQQVESWAQLASDIAPTLVGGSKKHGGPDLGPTRAKRAWAKLGVDGHGLADAPPAEDFSGMPRLTVSMAATLQGFPGSWQFAGRKTAAYRQVGNAFPPPVAAAVGASIAQALRAVRPRVARRQPQALAVAAA